MADEVEIPETFWDWLEEHFDELESADIQARLDTGNGGVWVGIIDFEDLLLAFSVGTETGAEVLGAWRASDEGAYEAAVASCAAASDTGIGFRLTDDARQADEDAGQAPWHTTTFVDQLRERTPEQLAAALDREWPPARLALIFRLAAGEHPQDDDERGFAWELAEDIGQTYWHGGLAYRPVPGAVQVDTAGSIGSVTFALDDVIEAWPQALRVLKAPLRAGIQDAQPIALENGVIVFGVPERRYDAISDRFRKEADAIEGAIASQLGAAPRFTLRPYDFDPGGRPWPRQRG